MGSVRTRMEATTSPCRDHCQPKARPEISRPSCFQHPAPHIDGLVIVCGVFRSVVPTPTVTRPPTLSSSFGRNYLGNLSPSKKNLMGCDYALRSHHVTHLRLKMASPQPGICMIDPSCVRSWASLLPQDMCTLRLFPGTLLTEVMCTTAPIYVQWFIFELGRIHLFQAGQPREAVIVPIDVLQ